MFGKIKAIHFISSTCISYVFMSEVMLLIHSLINSGSVECTSRDCLPLFEDHNPYHFIFPKINKGG